MSALTIDPRRVLDCCGSRHWQELMASELPGDSLGDLLAAAERAFAALSREDWMQAFAEHSMIGAPREGDHTGAAEQAGLAGASGELRMALAAANLEYRTRFGFVFLIRARGRGPEELLAALRRRLENPAEAEFANACAQQREITRLRLEGVVEAAGSRARPAAAEGAS